MPDALRELKRRGLTLAILSNGSPKSIDAVVSHAGLRDAFDHLLSADEAQVYKPDHRVYEIAVRTLQLDRKEILFVSSNAWDATGARSFGFPVCWINRSGNVFEEMGQRPDYEVNGLQGVVALFD